MREALLRWAEARRGPVPARLVERAEEAAETALGRARAEEGSAAEILRARGIRIEPAHLRVGPVSVRARLDLGAGTLTWDPEALEAMARALAWGGRPVPEDPLDLVLAHEVFHLLAPECPPEVAEAAAHLFATRLLDLPWFAGEADLVERDFLRPGRRSAGAS